MFGMSGRALSLRRRGGATLGFAIITAGQAGSGTSATATLNVAVAATEKVIALTGMKSTDVNTITDTVGNSYTQDLKSPAFGTPDLGMTVKSSSNSHTALTTAHSLNSSAAA